MKVSRLRLSNFRAFQSLELVFEKDLTLLAGENGVGKSSALLATSALLSQMLPKLTLSREKPAGFEWSDIQHGKAFYEVVLKMVREKQIFTGRESKHKGSKKGDRLFTCQPFDATEQKDGVLAVYYGVQRAMLSLPRTLADKDMSDPSAAYARALAGDRIDIKAFMGWYRIQQELGLSREGIVHAVEQAVKRLMPGFSRLVLETKPKLKMTLEKNGTCLNLAELSDGERSTLALVVDLARRLALANPDSKDPTREGRAVVLIDEIEQHLHPEWQCLVLARLRDTFPACQFIVTTHSPQVLREIPGRCIRYLYRDEDTGQVACKVPSLGRGLDSSQILERVMDVPRRNQEIDQKIKRIFERIEFEDYDLAKSEIKDLREDLGGDLPDLVEADTLIHMYHPDNVGDET